jgi:5-formyltetrahydrofolate cyclo-ligase
LFYQYIFYEKIGGRMVLRKDELRKEIRDLLRNLGAEMYNEQSNAIAQSLFKDEWWKSASTVGITISKPPEVDTYQIIRQAWDEGKRVVVPKCFSKERRMDFRVLENFDQLETVYFSLLEPIESQTTLIDPKEIELLLVPGLAFTKDGFRLGVGGGYYDRFLEFNHVNTLSLAFHQQIVPKIPLEKHDIPVMKIITDKEIYSVS